MPETVHTTIKFDGPATEERSMDVSHLAPALLALGELIKAANQQVNGDRTHVRVLVNANLEQKCFELNVEFVLTLWERTKLLLSNEDVASVQKLLVWLGILGGGSATGGVGLYKLIKWLKGQRVESSTETTLDDGSPAVLIRVGDRSDPLTVNRVTIDFYNNLSIRKNAIEVLAPLREDGYDSLQFSQEGAVDTEFGKDDVPELDGADLPMITSHNEHTARIRATIRIRKAVYEGPAKWNLVYHKASEMAIEDAEWLERFQKGQVNAPPGSSLDVDLEEAYTVNEDGELIGTPRHRVLKVYRVILPPKPPPLLPFDA